MTTTVTFDNAESLIGQSLGSTEWMEITQARVNTFADATDDPQWIHVDPERAKDGPFGGTIAHGYLTLSLIVPMFTDLLDVEGVTTKLNLGLNRVRFTSPVKVGSSIRLTASMADVKTVGGGGKELVWDGTIEVQGSDKPACVLQAVYRFYP
ncbi:MAG: MaoC family dehydratase [Dermatophilaceae bacterium]